MPNNNNKTCNYQVARLSCSYHFSDTKLLNNFLCFSKIYHVPKFTADSEYYFPAGSELKNKVETQKKALEQCPCYSGGFIGDFDQLLAQW